MADAALAGTHRRPYSLADLNTPTTGADTAKPITWTPNTHEPDTKPTPDTPTTGPSTPISTPSTPDLYDVTFTYRHATPRTRHRQPRSRRSALHHAYRFGLLVHGLSRCGLLIVSRYAAPLPVDY